MELREGILHTLPVQARQYITALEQQAAGADRWRVRHDDVSGRLQVLESRYDHLEEE